MPFPAMQALFDPLLPKGLQWYWKGDFVKSLPDDAIDLHIAQAAHAPSTLSLMHLYPIDGAVRWVAKDRTAWSARDAMWSMVIAAIDPDPAVADRLKSWGRAYWKAVHPYNLGGAYINFMMDDEADDRLRATYGDNFGRLGADQGEVGSRKPLPRQSEYRTGARLSTAWMLRRAADIRRMRERYVCGVLALASWRVQSPPGRSV